MAVTALALAAGLGGCSTARPAPSPTPPLTIASSTSPAPSGTPSTEDHSRRHLDEHLAGRADHDQHAPATIPAHRSCTVGGRQAEGRRAAGAGRRRTAALEGGEEEGFEGNGTWVHSRDPRYAAQDVIGVGCAPIIPATTTPIRSPRWRATTRRKGGAPGVAPCDAVRRPGGGAALLRPVSRAGPGLHHEVRAGSSPP